MISKFIIISLCGIVILFSAVTLSPEQTPFHPTKRVFPTNYKNNPFPIPITPHYTFTKSVHGNLVLPVYINDGKPVAEFIPPAHPEDQFTFPADK